MANDRDEPASPRRNRLRAVREELMLSRAELARRAGVSALTVNRIEDGENCRVDTKRNIILALGLKLSDKEMVFASGAERPKAAAAARKRRT